MDSLHRRTCGLALLWLVASTTAAAQNARGTVRSADGTPVAGANVFVLETLEGALTDSAGRFSFAVSAPRPYTLLVKRLGFREIRREVAAADHDELVLVLDRAPTALAAITVRAGAYTAGAERGATLTALEVVTTPGTSADINRTIQLLPGVQAVDDGTALFVRGGDYTETKVFMNEAQLLNPQQFLTPSGTFVGTVDPFQLDGIFFSSGGFGARYGNALSGVVGLRTRGATPRHTATVGAGLAATSADVALRTTSRLTLRLAGNRTDLSPFFRVNRNPRGFAPAPNGHDVSTSGTFTYGVAGEIKAFVLDQANLVGVPVDDPSFLGTFNSDVASRLSVVTWKDVVGPVATLVSASQASLNRREHYGAFRLDADQQLRQLFAQASWEAFAGTTVRAGGEVEHLRSDIAGSLAAPSDRGDSTRATLYAFAAPATRIGLFTEIDWQPLHFLKLVPGVRTDRSTLTEVRTFDPRLSAAWRVADGVVATGAWGIYHQVADPLFYDDAIGRAGLPAMRADQSVVGLQLGGEGSEIVRIEGYHKRYTNLALLNRASRVFAPGSGTSRGIDLFIKSTIPGGVTTRTTVSYLRSRRTEANTGTQAPAPFDVTWSSTFIAEKAFANGLRVGGNWRSSSGRPFSPVTRATYDAAADRWDPVYGAPNSERFPGIRRFDLSLSRYRPLTPSLQSVVYLSLSNLFNAQNAQNWKYSRDYGTRTPLPSIFNRSVYFGATLIWQ